jgi:hypothetical protein
LTEGEKALALEQIEARAAAAERAGLRRTARSWRDYAASVAARPAAEMALAGGAARLMAAGFEE